MPSDRDARWAVMNPSTSLDVTAAGSFETTAKKIFRSDAVASTVLNRALADTNSK